MTTQLDQLLEKWRKEAKNVFAGSPSATLATRYANELEAAIKDSLQEPHGSPYDIIRNLVRASDSSWYHDNKGHDWKDAVDEAEAFLQSKIATKPLPLKVRRTEEQEALERWMREVTVALVSLTSIPSPERDAIDMALIKYRKAIEKPLKE